MSASGATIVELRNLFPILNCNFAGVCVCVFDAILIFVAFQLNRFAGHLTLSMLFSGVYAMVCFFRSKFIVQYKCDRVFVQCSCKISSPKFMVRVRVREGCKCLFHDLCFKGLSVNDIQIKNGMFIELKFRNWTAIKTERHLNCRWPLINTFYSNLIFTYGKKFWMTRRECWSDNSHKTKGGGMIENIEFCLDSMDARKL